ncbi:bifunctional MFS transporter/dTMP kinase [Allokutzneria oryzae]|uniref:Bifunctional MFS transporter/dTMP kinase n=1 Tax=Allokutzneria oryzae TaxID=1378989 RepID=A0ABV5ZZ87_9PSEU
MGDAGTEPVSTAHRVRSVLAIQPFRRLWAVNALSSVGDWLSLLALSALATNMTSGYQAQSFALGGVVVTKLLPALLFAPVAGALADKVDRRALMAICDVLRCLLLVSVPLVGSLWWLFAATFLLELVTLFWAPAKDAAVPNLLRRPDQVETANQLNMVMTYGVSVVTASGLFTALTVVGPTLALQLSPTGTIAVALVLNAVIYLGNAITVATRVPEISSRAHDAGKLAGESLFSLVRDGLKFVGTTPLVRGLVIGIAGAFAAGGAVIACAKLYAVSLSGGDGTYGLLFVSVFSGLGVGMVFAPRLAARMPHNRLFGAAIIAAGVAMIPASLAPHLWVALVTVALVGASAGAAFLTGMTIIGAQVEDTVRGRTVAFMQSLVRLVLMGAMALVPVLVAVVPPVSFEVLGRVVRIDPTRPVLLTAGLVAALAGVVAYRQMDDRRSGVRDLLAALVRTPRTGSGLLLSVEGDTVTETAAQARLLAGWLREGGHGVLLAGDPALEGERLRDLAEHSGLTGRRAHTLLAAAVRADVVERQVLPALEAGSVVVLVCEPTSDAPEGLADWATGRLRPEVTVLLDRAPAVPTGRIEHTWRHVLTELAAADPDRYVVVDADGDREEVAQRVREAVLPALSARRVTVPPTDGSLASSEAG